MPTIRRLLIANRGEIAIRVSRATAELGVTAIAIYSEEDRFSLHRLKVDEAYRVGAGRTPVAAYLDIEDIVRIARETRVDAIHPGYGFLSESPEFAEACRDAGIIFVGPSTEVLRRLGNKVEARALAAKAGVPTLPATPPLADRPEEMREQAKQVGYPLMLKASWGGGGRGLGQVEGPEQLAELVAAGRREAEAAFGNGEVYLEKLIRHARHVEVQILGDRHGNLVHLFERDCTVQRRNQKVIERAPALFLDEAGRHALCEAALAVGRAVGYENAGTVEFLMDADTGEFYFIEVNPRIQVEHTVTEEVTGIDIVKAQIRIAAGAKIGTESSGVPTQGAIARHGHAMQCRVTAEDPENNFIPDYGTIIAYRSPAGLGIRLDASTAYAGARLLRYYDSLLVKVTARGNTADEVVSRMHRALREFRVRGVATNLRFLEGLITHPDFKRASYTTGFIDQHPKLFKFPKRRDRATRLLNFIGDVIVNGNSAVEGRSPPSSHELPQAPVLPSGDPQPGSRQLLEALGPEKFARWMLEQERVLVTDTTFRDAHQSLLATRVRSYDLLRIAPAYARLLPGLFSIECWGGATFDVSMRFLNECPWERLRELRARVPNVLLQMLLRASNGVGYTNYPDNVLRYFVEQAAREGVDVFRIFDCLNWVENMRVAMDAVLETGKLVEAAICYTGNLSDPACTKYDLGYYVRMAKELESAGAHILGIKDMAGLCRPDAARTLVRALKQEIAIPIHFHTHDTSGIAAASVFAAVDAGVDAFDAAMDSMSGLTSQPNLGSVVEALRHGPRDPGLDGETIRTLSRYWEQVRSCYSPFESDIRSGTSEVYLHGMPGGQYTNLREQARALGVGARWAEVARAYADVNEMLGDIVKVTPSSKVVGDMALLMVTNDLSRADVEDPHTEIAFPTSMLSLLRGELGQPTGGFPEALQKKALKGEPTLTERPAGLLPPADLSALRREAEKRAERRISDAEFGSYLMYPDVFIDYVGARRRFGNMSVVPTPVFFYGMTAGQEIALEIETGKVLIITFVAASEHHADGRRTLFFELNGQPRSAHILDRSQAATTPAHPKAQPGNDCHVGATMPGLISTLRVAVGDQVERGDILLSIEAMKMETSVSAERAGRIAEISVSEGQQVDLKDLLLVYE